MKNKIENKLFYLPIIIFGIYLVIRLIDQSKLITTFPLDYTNDISSYIAQLHFLKVCGFHEMCYYWYNGFNTFLFTPPAWYLFTLPIYLFLDNILLSTYISIIILYLLGLIGFILMGKLNGFSKIKSIGLFLLFFSNPITIGEFLRLGRVTSFLGWICIIYLFSIILYYKNKPLDKYFLFFIPLYAVLILSHLQELVLFSFILLGFFLIKTNKERILIILSGLISLLITSFWLIPFIFNLNGRYYPPIYSWLINFKGNDFLTNLISFIVIIIFFYLFYLNWIQNNKSKKIFLFYLPSLVLGILLFSRLIIFIPILKYIAQDPYIYYFTLLALYLFIKTEFSKKILRLISIVFVLLVLISVSISIIHTPWFTEYTPLEYNTLELFKDVNGRFFIFGSYPTSYSRAYDSYMPIYNNLSSAVGWSPHITKKDYIDKVNFVYNSYNIGDCNNIKSGLNELNVSYAIVIDKDCDKLPFCDLILKNKKDGSCLYLN